MATCLKKKPRTARRTLPRITESLMILLPRTFMSCKSSALKDKAAALRSFSIMLIIITSETRSGCLTRFVSALVTVHYKRGNDENQEHYGGERVSKHDCEHLLALQLFGQHRHNLEQVADNAVGGYLKDGGVGGVIDSHDAFGGLHAGHVLHRAGDAAGDIE